MKYYINRCRQALSRLRDAAARAVSAAKPALRGRTLCVAIVTLAMVGIYGKYISGPNIFLFVEDGKMTVHRTYSDDADQALLEAGIHIGLNDYVATPESAADGVIQIYRAMAVTVTMDGASSEYTLFDGTVASALRIAGYEPMPLDIIEPPSETHLLDGMDIVVTRREVFTLSVDEVIPFETLKEDNPYIRYGTEVVTQPGADGFRSASYIVTMHDGAEVSREVISESMTPPVTEIVQCGNGGTVTMKDGTVLKYKQRFDVIATAYTTERQTNKLNAIGNIARVGTIAVDPKVIKLRTKVYVVAANNAWEYGIALCEDTGGVIKGNKIDIYFDSWDYCLEFGIRKAVVYILE